jgi:exodeoxyribonuclease VIII
MVDLETLGTVPGSVILSIGARAFDVDRGLLGPGFYRVVNTVSCEAIGLTRDRDTEWWWAKQHPEAKTVLTHAMADDAPTIQEALTAFNAWMATVKGRHVWGKGSDFDNALLAVAYRRCELPMPWKFWDSRCHRTLVSLFPDIKEPKRTGTYHNALDDATTQAMHALMIFGGFEGWAEGCAPAEPTAA